MNLKQARRLIDRHIRHGDMATAAREMGVQWQTVQQHIRGNRQASPAAQKYILKVAEVIGDRKRQERLADSETTKEAKRLIESV